jgi:hypothetical protein
MIAGGHCEVREHDVHALGDGYENAKIMELP